MAAPASWLAAADLDRTTPIGTPLEETGGGVGAAEFEQLLVGADLLAVPGGDRVGRAEPFVVDDQGQAEGGRDQRAELLPADQRERRQLHAAGGRPP